MNEIPPCCWWIYDPLWCADTGVGASTQCSQMTDPGPCQLAAERYLLQVLLRDSGHLAQLGKTRNAQRCQGALGVLSWWATTSESL